MTEYSAGTTDVAVIGAGHAGVEAALACARLGVRTTLFTMSLDAVANMPCNPSIGGTAKGHLVREIDALGGEMGRAADAWMLQSRMLNRGKGPAVHSLRAQVDRAQYHLHIMKRVVETQPNLQLKQAEIVDIRTGADGAVCAVVTDLGAVFGCRAAILCTGTYLGAKIFVGDEDLGHELLLRGQFDLVTARAVARLNVLSEYCLPFVRIGGQFAALKGPEARGELQEAEAAVGVLGGRVRGKDNYELPMDNRRSIVVVEKRAPTPPKYPRKPGQISKTPLS